MKLICERDSLNAALHHVSTRARSKLKIPILQHVKIDAANNGLTLTATDLDTRSEARVPAEIATSGATTVNADRLSRLVEGLPTGSQVDIESRENELRVECGRSRYKMPTLPIEDFPLMTELQNPIEFALSAADVKRLMGEPIAAAVTTEARPFLHSGHFHQLSPDQLAVVCTDGARLVRMSISTDLALKRSYIIPKPTMIEIVKLAARGGELRFRLGNNLIEASTGNLSFTSKLVDAEYPNVERVIPPLTAQSIMVDRAEFVGAFKRLVGLTNEYSIIDIEWGGSEPWLAMTLDGEGSGSERIACECDLPNGRVAFAPAVLGSMLEVFKCDVLHLHPGGLQRPMRIVDPDDDGLLVLAMPCGSKKATQAELDQATAAQ